MRRWILVCALIALLAPLALFGFGAVSSRAAADGDPDEFIADALDDVRRRSAAESDARGAGAATDPAPAVAPAVPATAPAATSLTGNADPKWRLHGSGEASEYYDLLARLDSGHTILARFLVTNIGPGEGTAVALGEVIAPDGSTRPFRNGQRKGGWDASDDRLRIDVKNSHLDLHWGEVVLEVTKKATQIELRMPLNRLAPLPRDGLPNKYKSDVLAAHAPVSGRMQVKGIAEETAISGRGSLVHTWMGKLEETRVHRRVDVFSVGESDASIEIVEIQNPSGEVHSWLRVIQAGRMLAEIPDVELIELGQLEGSSSKYPVPKAFELKGPGVEGRIELSRLIFDQNPMRAIPQPARALIEWATDSEPHQVWAHGRFDVTLRPDEAVPPVSLQGDAMTAVGYLKQS